MYSGSSLKGHPWNKDTWLISTLDRVPTLCKCIILFSPWNKGTSLIRTIALVPMVSVLERLHCTIHAAHHAWGNISMLHRACRKHQYENLMQKLLGQGPNWLACYISCHWILYTSNSLYYGLLIGVTWCVQWLTLFRTSQVIYKFHRGGSACMYF